MKAKARKRNPKQVLVTKVILYSAFLTGIAVCPFVIPKEILSDNQIYSAACSSIVLDDDQLVLKDYKVYSTQKKMKAALESDPPLRAQEFKKRNEVLVVRIHGEEKESVQMKEYTLLYDPATIELNIEYCIAQTISMFGVTAPTRTFIPLAKDVAHKATAIYWVFVSLLLSGIACPLTIGLSRSLYYLKHGYFVDAPDQEPDKNEIEETKTA